MILAEQLVLLSLDPDQGRFARGIDRERLRRGAAAAILAELVLHKRLVGDVNGVRLSDSLPDFHPMLAEAVRALRHGGTLTIDAAVDRVAHGIGSLLQRLLDSLVARDILHEQRQAFVFRRYPVRSMQALSEVYNSLHAVMSGQRSTPQAHALAAAADACGVLDVRMTPEERFRVRRYVDPRPLAPAEPAREADAALILAFAQAAARHA
jgi:hypothetical protein